MRDCRLRVLEFQREEFSVCASPLMCVCACVLVCVCACVRVCVCMCICVRAWLCVRVCDREESVLNVNQAESKARKENNVCIN